MLGEHSLHRVGVGQVGVHRQECSWVRRGGQSGSDGPGRVGRQICGDDGVPALQQDLRRAPADLTERSGDENCALRHQTMPRFRASRAAESRKRGEIRTENRGLNTSSRSLVSVDVLIRHRPSAFS